MSNNSVSYFFIFRWVEFIRLRNLMNLHFASCPRFIRIENSTYIYFCFTATILIIRTEWSVQRHFHFWLLLVDMAVSHFGNVIENPTPVALEDIKIRPDFPINFSPWNSVSFSYECYKFFKIPWSVYNVLSSYLAVEINVRLSLTAVQNFSLAHSE